MYKLVSLFLLLLGCAAPKETPPCGFDKTIYGDYVKNKHTVILYIDQTFPIYFAESAFAAAKTWNDAVGRELIVVDYSNMNKDPYDGANVLKFLSPWTFSASSLGVTSLMFGNNMIYDADISINPNYVYYKRSSPIWGAISMESLLLHEMGHMLGMEHSDQPDSAMRPTMSNNTELTLNATDIENVRCVY